MTDQQATDDAKKVSVLVVDDEKYIRYLLTEIIDMNGYQLSGEAENGKEAVQMYKEKKPDLVMMDIMMPEMDGLSALKEIMEFDPEAKVIMLTAAGERGFIKDALNAGAADYITKPFLEERVLFGIEKAFSDV